MVKVVVEYGLGGVPSDVLRAALTRGRHFLAAPTSGVPDRATSITMDGGGTIALTTPGLRGSKTGIPDVDVVLARYSYSLFDDIIGGA
jgi:hypothetical protein